jgi:hypothetical protein
MKTSIVLPAALALAAAALPAPRAAAGINAANATAFCQGALPVFDVQIRKRPLGVNNEGDSPAFVSCSIPYPHNAVTVSDAVLHLSNRTDTAVVVNCTLVDGVAPGLPFAAAMYYPKSIILAANSSDPMIWLPGEYELETFGRWQNYSCSLPPGIEINMAGYDFTEAS